jgi:uncharacterized protein YaiL (DUF2058 family)
MSMSLRDQLLQAGLLSEKQAKQASKQQGQQRREQARQPAAVDERQRAAQKAADEKRARDLELNRQAQEKAEQKARKAQVKQLVEQNRVAKPDSDEWYNFIDGKKVRRIPADAPMRERLGRGELMVVRCEGRYELVPAAIAERIAERDAHAVIPRNAAPAAVDENDPYKDYVVPDDLTW